MFSFIVLKLKGSGVIFAQNKSGIEFLACLAGQSFQNRSAPISEQITDILFREKRAADLTEDMEVAAFIPTLGNLDINADTLLSAFWASVNRLGLLFGSK